MSYFLRLLVVVLFIACGAILQPAIAATEAGNYQHFDALAPLGNQPGRQFGRAIAIEGDLAVIGAPTEMVDGKLLHGAAYIFTQADGRWRQRARLALTDGNASMQFGGAVAISGGQILIGASSASGGGQVYVFDGSGSSWSESQRFRPSGTGGFGHALAVQGDRLLIGAPEESGGGRAYVYARSGTTWALQDQLEASDRSSGDKFGRAVALDADHAIVGAPFQGGFSTGSAYPFEFDGVDWNAGAPLNNIVTPSANEGWALAMASDHLLVGAPGEDSQGENSVGTVLYYQFGGGSWQLQERVDGPVQAASGFGTSLAFDGSTMFAGAPGITRAWGRRGRLFEVVLEPSGFASPDALPDPDVAEGIGRSIALFSDGLMTGDQFSDVGGVSSDGRVTIFRNSGGWHIDGVLDAPQLDITRRFGRVVSVSGDRAAVGIPWETVGGNAQQGSVQLFDFDGQRWNWSATVTDPFGNASDRFGSSLVLDGDRLIVGAPNRQNSGMSGAGSAVLFEFDGANWNVAYRYDNTAASNDYMGTAVALDGDRAAIGAPRANLAASLDNGLVLVLEHSAGSWSSVASLSGTDANERLGGTLVFSGTSLAAAATNANSGAGRVRIYRKIIGNWSQLTTISAPAGSTGFGSSMDFRDGLLAVGAPTGDGGAGRVSAYREGTTNFSAETLPAIPVAGVESLGSSVSIDNHRLVAGSLDNGTDSAGVFLFDRDAGGSWSYTGRIASPDGSALFPDGFGTALSLRRPHLLAGAEWRAKDEGRAFAYIEGRENSVAIDSLSPTQPVTGQPIAIQASASNVDGPADGRIRWLREDRAACTAVLAAGSGSCSLPGANVGVQTFVGEFLPETLPDLPMQTASVGYQVVAANTLTSLSAMPATAHPGEDIELTASVSVQAPGSGSPGGSVSFHAGDPDVAPALCSVPVASGSCTVAAGDVGSMDFQARYSGDVDFDGSDSTVATISITAWPTTVNLTGVNPLPAKVGQSLAATVTVSADAAAGTPAGRVRLILDGQPGAWANLDGSGQAIPSVLPQTKGSQILLAEFDGQGGAFANTSGGSQQITVVALDSGVAVSAMPDSGIQAGDTVTLTATVTLEDASNATGTIRIHPESAANPALCTVAAPSGSCDFVPPTSGSFGFVAVYDGDARSGSSSGSTSISAQRADTVTEINVIPSSPTVDQIYTVSIHVVSGYGQPAGTVSVSDGESSCQIVLVGGDGSCQLTASYVGTRNVAAHYAATGSVHADSDAAATGITVEGIPVTLGLAWPEGNYTVGDSLSLQPTLTAIDASIPADGIVTLRLDDASGTVVCAQNPPLDACLLTLPTAGTQHFHLAYAGSSRYATGEALNWSIPVTPIQTAISVLGTDPVTVLTDAGFDLIVAVSGSNGVAPGTLDVLDVNGAVCTGLTPYPGDGLYRCAMTAPSFAGGYPLTLAFNSGNGNYSHAAANHEVTVVSAIRQIEMRLDDGVTAVEAGDPLLYALEVRNLAAAGTVSGVQIGMPLVQGISILEWSCTEALGGAVCPVIGSQTGALLFTVDLPPASLLVFEILAEVDTPVPSTVEVAIAATLPDGESNDDADALYAIDVNIRADGLLFGSGFESTSPP